MELLLRLVSLFCLFLNLEMMAGVRECTRAGNKLKCENRNLIKVPIAEDGLQWLYLDNNPLEKLTYDSFTSWKRLFSLSLKNCQLRYIDNDAFRPLLSLEILDLSDNLLSFEKGISVDVFVHLGKLVELTMDRNPLRTIPNNAFTAQTNLKTLTLSETKGGLKLNNKSFNGLKKLSKLDLDENKLTTLPVGIRESFRWEILNFYLNDNEIHCDCKLRWLNELKPAPKYIMGKCASPSNMKGTNLYTGDPDQYMCGKIDMSSSEEVKIDMSSSEEASSLQCYQFTDRNLDIEEMKRELSADLVNPKPMGNGWLCFGDTHNEDLLLEVSETLKWTKRK